MQLVCRNDIVLATHDDNQSIPKGLYGPGTFIVPFAGSVNDLQRKGEAPAPSNFSSQQFIDGRPYLVPANLDMAAYIAARRYAAEENGITIQGMKIATDRGSQAKINGAYNLVKEVPTTKIKFKAGEGFVELDAAMITAVSVTVGQYVQGCFAKESELLEELATGPGLTVVAVNDEFAALELAANPES